MAATAERARAEDLRVAATRRLHDLDPTAGAIEPTGSPLADALEALGRAAAAASRRFGPSPPWHAAVAITGGMIVVPTRRAGVKGGRQAVP